MNYCPKCNKYVEDDTLRFCEDCGTPFIRLKTGKAEIDKANNQIVARTVEEIQENDTSVNGALQQMETLESNPQLEAKQQVMEKESPAVNQNGTDINIEPPSLPKDNNLHGKETVVLNSEHISENKKFGMGVIAGLVAALVMGGAFFFITNNGKKEVTDNTISRQEEVTRQKKEAPIVPEPEKPKVVPKTNMDLAKEYLMQRGYDGSHITATTYGLSNKGFLCYGNKMITVVDTKNSQVAYLLNTDEVIGEYKLFRKNNDNKPLILKFFLGKEVRDKDANAGYWENGNHYLPIYALYDFKPDGSMEHGGLYTGGGRNPSHYHSYLYEMKNVDIADIVLTQLVKLGPGVLSEFPVAKDPYNGGLKSEQKQQNISSVNNNNNVGARNTFISFHQAITNGQLRTAFNILSPDYQKFMQSYDHFARGYTTTLRSDIVDLKVLHEDNYSATYAYTLKAVDREGNGQKIQFFAGKAKLININGRWRIDSTEAKRL